MFHVTLHSKLNPLNNSALHSFEIFFKRNVRWYVSFGFNLHIVRHENCNSGRVDYDYVSTQSLFIDQK